MSRGPSAPVGVFDSGLGGLSVLREMRRVLPRETFCYVGDTAQVPWGGRADTEIRQFSLAIARFLIEEQHCRALVIACNTATAAAADWLRETYTDPRQIPVVAMEPGIKPAAGVTRTRVIGMLATPSTLKSERVEQLVARYAPPEQVTVLTAPGLGWVEAVESGDWDGPETRAAVARVVEPLVARGADTLILGCTHYPFLMPLIADVAGPNVTLIDTGPAIARQVARVLARSGEQGSLPAVVNVEPSQTALTAPVRAWVTGDVARADRVARRCLGPDAPLTLTGAVWSEGELRDATNRWTGQSGFATDKD